MAQKYIFQNFGYDINQVPEIQKRAQVMINLMKSKSENIIKEAEQAADDDALEQDTEHSIEVIDPTIFNSKFSNDLNR